MNLNVQVDASDVVKQLEGYAKEIKSSFAKSLNRIANDVQNDERVGINQNFTIAQSRQRFFRNMVKRTKDDMANPTRLVAAVRVEGPLDSLKRSELLTRHEEGGPQYAAGNLFFLPSKEIRPTNTSLPPRSLYPKALRLMDMRGIGGATDSILKGGTKGKRRTISGLSAKLGQLKKVGLGGTFMIQRPGGTAAIFQRQGEGREGLTLLWSLIPRIRLPKRLAFFATAEKSVSRTAEKHIVAAVENAARKL